MPKERKAELLKLLKNAPKPLNGQSLAEHFHVTRQIIVQDIALLRADGATILSTNRGYVYKEQESSPYVHRLFKVKHDTKAIETELLAIVDNGGRVQNIQIDHPVYGEIQTLVKLTCRRDVQHFLEQIHQSDFRPLSSLTDGVHYHLVEAENQQDLDYIEDALDKLGYLVKEDYTKGAPHKSCGALFFCSLEEWRFPNRFACASVISTTLPQFVLCGMFALLYQYTSDFPFLATYTVRYSS